MEVIKEHKFVCVSGYGWTGSGACIDLLKEFKGFGVLKGEFRIVKDPYGIKDLEASLVHNWDFIRHDVAIRDFLNYCEVLSRETGLFKKSGKDLSNKLGVDFMLESRLYINALTDFRYFGDTFVHRYNIPAFQNFFLKLRSKMGKKNAISMYFSRPSKDVFLKETQKYINNLFCAFNNIDTIVLDQAIPATNIFSTKQYFKNMKVIVIDRDPRDIYINMIKRKKLLGPDLINSESVDKYIKWHKCVRQDNGASSDKEVLKLYFEDLILKYDESVSKIIDFFGSDIEHDKKMKFFLPSDSFKNTGLWKTYKDQDTMNYINKELKEYCYNVE